jgi:hypothetical protein
VHRLRHQGEGRVGVHRTRPTDHVLDRLSTLEESPDPLEVSHVRTRSCSGSSLPVTSFPRRHSTSLDGSSRPVRYLRPATPRVLRRRGRFPPFLLQFLGPSSGSAASRPRSLKLNRLRGASSTWVVRVSNRILLWRLGVGRSALAGYTAMRRSPSPPAPRNVTHAHHLP